MLLFSQIHKLFLKIRSLKEYYHLTSQEDFWIYLKIKTFPRHGACTANTELILESMDMGAIFHKNGKEMLKKGEIFKNLGNNVQNDCMIACNKLLEYSVISESLFELRSFSAFSALPLCKLGSVALSKWSSWRWG